MLPISPNLRACSSQRNKLRYGFCPELQSFHRLSQSGRRTSHRHSLNTLIGRDFLFRARLSKMKSARQCRLIAADSSVALSMPWLPRRESTSPAAYVRQQRRISTCVHNSAPSPTFGCLYAAWKISSIRCTCFPAASRCMGFFHHASAAAPRLSAVFDSALAYHQNFAAACAIPPFPRLSCAHCHG